MHIMLSTLKVDSNWVFVQLVFIRSLIDYYDQIRWLVFSRWLGFRLIIWLSFSDLVKGELWICRDVVSTGPLAHVPPDLASGPPTFGFYWPELATYIQSLIYKKIIINQFFLWNYTVQTICKIGNSWFFLKFHLQNNNWKCGSWNFDPGHLNLIRATYICQSLARNGH